MNFPDMTNGLIGLAIFIAFAGYGIIRLIEWALSHISIVIG